MKIGKLEGCKLSKVEEILLGFNNKLEFIDGAHRGSKLNRKNIVIGRATDVARVLTIIASGQHWVASCSLLAQLHHLRSGFD
ncbi:hypothetical protein NL676_029775 [Syzygium grande]|nr:hypothetical protein NL676_029775 [Syzygium grande]